ncbi:MAG TPA: vanadium-dependent haloperoxidase, partial [Gaiellaceae bacterium]|nr:vanadium-dependent haloperoxidase [Gaiellaceae bacterium]
RLTRRELVLGAGGALVAAGAFGLPGAKARAGPRFPGADELDAGVATAWFDLSRELVRRTPGFSPPVAARTFAYAALALYEAVAPGAESLRPLAGALPGFPGTPAVGRNRAYDWPTVANAALAEALRALFPPGQAAAVSAFETSLQARLRGGVPRGVVERSAQRGRDVAAAVVEWSTGDGGHEGYLRNFSSSYVPPAGPGLWVPTPPGFLPALQPFWGGNRCLALSGGADCPPGDHTPYSEDPGSRFHAEALEVYEAVNGLTEEQEQIARFWADDPGATATPPGHSISIATQVLRAEEASLAAAGETYARVGIAVCDAFVSCWHYKYRYNLLRPLTYIQRFDPAWLPLLATPPFPEYPSGHSVQSGAAARVLTDLFGDGYAFLDRTHENRGFAPRPFASFAAAAEEAAVSRLYGGIHFGPAIVRGLAQGECIGQAVGALRLRA